jgi:hypothetical protein
MSKIEVNTVAPQCGTTLTLGESGDTVTLGTGASQSGFGRTGTVDWQTGDIKTSTFTAESGKGYFCNTAGGTFEVDLPAGTAGAIVSIQDYNNTFDSNSLTVDPNGSEKINGGTAGGFVTLSTEGEGITLVYVDSTVGWRSIQDNVFADPGAIPTYVAATGGTVTTVCTNFKVHTFTGPGTFCVSCAGNAFGSNTVSYMVVAGGGGGGKCRSGGGGAGGFREGRTTTCSYSVSPLNAPAGLPVSATGYPITVGSGGAGSTSVSARGVNGSDSIFSSITSAGGGGGGSDSGAPINPGANGGSGGGGANSAPGGTGNTPPVSPAQGTNGGQSLSGSGGAGGGGATDAGSNMPSPSIGGQGGDGATTSINATPTVRAGGGGGGSGAGAGSPGGTGGGGPGRGNGQPTCAGAAGTTNTGGGGGGTSEPGSGGGGAGGSGIVIIRYKFQ